MHVGGTWVGLTTTWVLCHKLLAGCLVSCHLLFVLYFDLEISEGNTIWSEAALEVASLVLRQTEQGHFLVDLWL